MQKLPLLLSLAFMTTFLSAQIPNSDMEFWTGAPTLISWRTNSNPLTLPPYDPYIVRQDSDSYSGQWAADLYGNGVFKPWAITAFAVAQHPATLSLYYKSLFPPCVNGTNALKDTASLLVELMSNGAVVDRGYWQSTTANPVYSPLVVPLSQNATVFDSCRITVTGGKASTTCQGATWHTQFKIDHLQLNYYNGANCIDSSHICDTCICNGPYQPVCGCNGVTYVNSCAAYSAGVSSWNTGSCSNSGCIDSSRICDTCMCYMIYSPVCGCNGVTYSNSCFALNAGVLSWVPGSCSNSGGCGAYFTYTTDSSGSGLDFSDASSGTYDLLLWDFGDSISVTTGIAPVHHVYAASGLYNVCLTIFSRDSSCYNTYCQTLAIAPPGPCPDTTLIQSGMSCTTVYSPVCGCDGVTYSNACEAFYHYGVTSFTSGACQVPVLCYANYYYRLDSNGYTAYFEYGGAGQTGPIGNANASLMWNFGDGTTGTGLNPIHTYADTSIHAYRVCLTVIDTIHLCTDTFCDSVRLGRQVRGCYAGFGYAIDSTGIVTLYPDSVNGGIVTGTTWILGSDTISANPNFQVNSGSYYNICYVVTNDSMHCSDTVCVNAHQLYLAHMASGNQDILTDLSQIYLYPNPTLNTSEIRFMTIRGGLVDITVRNLLGETVYQLPQLQLNAGSYGYMLNLNGLSSGVYMVELRFDYSAATVRKLVKM